MIKVTRQGLDEHVHPRSLTRALHVRIQRGTGGPDSHTLENQKNIGFLSYTGLDPLKNYKATMPAFNVVPASPRQRNAI